MSNGDGDDVFDVGSEGADGSLALQKVKELSIELRDAEGELKRLEDAMSTIKRHAHDLKTRRIPNAMAELGATEFTLEDGSKIKISDYVSGTINSLQDEGARARALELLEEYGGTSIIKTDVHVFFDKSEYERAMEIAKELQAQGIVPEVKTSVNPQSLQAFVRERLKAGEQVDLEALGMNAGRMAKINLPKAKVR